MEEVTVNKNETSVKINKFVTIIIDEKKFNPHGDVAVDYNDDVLTAGEAKEIVNEYFAGLIRFIQNKTKVIKI